MNPGVALEASGMMLDTLKNSALTEYQRPDLLLKERLNAFRAVRVLDQFDTHHLVLWSAAEERLAPIGHPGLAYAMNRYGPSNMELVKEQLKDPSIIFGVPILEVEDEEGHVLKHVHLEPRLYHRDCPEVVPARTLVVIPELSVLHRPLALGTLNPADAVRMAEPSRGVLERWAFLKAREAVEVEEAFRAFEVLFKHYSLNEELCRLDEFMKKLPFTLEEHPGMEKYRGLLEQQIGHLRKGAKNWYQNGSPAAGIGLVDYVQGICANPGLMPHRLRWLVAECRARGYKKVAEYGSIEGVSLFHLIQIAPDIEWHGFEVNPDTVKIGLKLAADAGLSDRFHLHVMGVEEHAALMGSFDAVALFEALEHNDENDGAKLLHAAERMVRRPDGAVFITTPWGNWSAFDDATRDVTLRKDHINAYTEKRMRDFLNTHAFLKPESLKVARIHNPSLHEYNSWVFAEYLMADWVRP